MVAVCVGTGFPVPSISWSLDGSPLENNSRVSIYEEVIVESGITFVQSFLEVCSVGFMDAGLYQCTVANRLANASSNFTLTINRVGGELQCCTHLLWQCYTTTILYAKILFPIWIFFAYCCDSVVGKLALMIDSFSYQCSIPCIITACQGVPHN